MFSIWSYGDGLGYVSRCEQYKDQIASVAGRYGLDPVIGIEQLSQESGCRSDVCSGQSACGIAQFIPGTWAQWGSGSRSDVSASLEAWGKYMRHLLTKFGGDYRLALAGYHSGEGAARAALNNCRGNPKTCNYVNSIMSAAGRSRPVASQPLPAPIPASPTLPTSPTPDLTLSTQQDGESKAPLLLTAVAIGGLILLSA